jgi:YidC/Oxa1 family membrane protein insertase
MWGLFVGFLELTLLWCARLTNNVGLGIILFTVFARLLLLPLTLKSLKSSRRMQELQPKIKELQRKHGKDQKKAQEEMLKLYQEHKVNPVGGCLPMLLQMPIFIGVYWAVLHLMNPEPLNLALQTGFLHPFFQQGLELFGAYPSMAYLIHHPDLSAWVQAMIVQDASIPRLLVQPFLTIDLGMKPFEQGFSHFNGIKYLILPVLSIVLQFTQQMMAMPRVQDPQQKSMSRMMMIMPLFFGYITLIFPAGAVLYWTTSSTIGIIQQYFTSGWGSLANHLKFLPPDKASRTAAATTTGPIETSAALPSDQPATTASAVAQRPGFWDVLRPLTEATSDESSASVSPTSSATEQRSEASKSSQAKKKNPRSSRRRR